MARSLALEYAADARLDDSMLQLQISQKTENTNPVRFYLKNTFTFRSKGQSALEPQKKLTTELRMDSVNVMVTPRTTRNSWETSNMPDMSINAPNEAFWIQNEIVRYRNRKN
jgi:hypothetical protein